MAAVLFKVETAVRNGYTSTTSSLCQWNQIFTNKVKLLVHDISSCFVECVCVSV